MLKARKKISKRELKEDKFVLFTLKAKDYVENNAKMLIRVGIGVLVLIIVVTLYVRSKHNAGIKAASLFGEAQFYYDRNNYNQAEEKLNELISDYAGVKAAGHGDFLLAKIYWQQSDWENAQKYFKKYIDDYADDDILTSAAMAGYADCLVNQGNSQEAAQYYEKAARVNKELPSVAGYYFSAARAYYDAKEFKKSEEMANHLIENYKDSQYVSEAKILLNMAKMES